MPTSFSSRRTRSSKLRALLFRLILARHWRCRRSINSINSNSRAMTQQHQVYFEMSQDKSQYVHRNDSCWDSPTFPFLHLTLLPCMKVIRGNSFADKEIMKLKLKTRRKGIKEQLGKGKDCQDLRYFLYFSFFLWGCLHRGADENWELARLFFYPVCFRFYSFPRI